MIHLQFKVGLCEALLDSWEMRNFIPEDDGAPPNYCVPFHSIVQKPCMACEIGFPHNYYHNCGDKYMCLRKVCYKCWHDALHRRLNTCN
jgi:hypothetical protein